MEETSAAQPGSKTKQRQPIPKKLCNRSLFTTDEPTRYHAARQQSNAELSDAEWETVDDDLAL